MLKRLILISVAFLLIFSGVSSVSCQITSDEQQIKNLVKRHIKATFNEDFRALYVMLSPGMRKEYSYEEFCQEYKEETEGLEDILEIFRNVKVTDIEVVIEGNKAYASYTMVLDKRAVEKLEELGYSSEWIAQSVPYGDTFIRIDGRWYREEFATPSERTEWPKKSKKEPPMPTPKKASAYEAKPFPNGIVLGDFSLALSQIERITEDKTDYTVFYFAVRRVKSTIDQGKQLDSQDDLWVTDDRGNIYSGFWRSIHSSYSLPIETKFLSAAPAGFTWTEVCKIEMPRGAPIVKVSLGDLYPKPGKSVWEIDCSTYHLVSPDFNGELREGLISAGKKITQGKHLRWSVRKIEVEHKYTFWSARKTQIGHLWLIPFEVENLDYNPQEFNLTIRPQLYDGTIIGPAKAGGIYLEEGGFFCESGRIHCPGYSREYGRITTEVPSQSKKRLHYQLAMLSEKVGSTPAQILILNEETEEKGELYILKVTPDLFVNR